MLIGIDTSGKFEIEGEYSPSVMAAAVLPPSASRAVSGWTADALTRWGREDLGEIHMQQLNYSQRLEVCRMLAGREDLRLAAVLTDQVLLLSPDRVRAHRTDQLALARTLEPGSAEGKERKGQVIRLLEGDALSDNDYVLAAVFPLVVALATQQAFCFFRTDEWRDDMTELRLLADEETPPGTRYATTSFLPVLGGDARFGFVTPEEWRSSPEHPLLRRARHSDGYLRPQAMFTPIGWESSHDHAALQVADAAAWVVRRAVMNPREQVAQECLDQLQPLFLGAGGMVFELFALRDVTTSENAIYDPFRWGREPPWWLQRAS